MTGACAQHPARTSLGYCRRCGKNVCEICAKWVEQVLFCMPCGVDTVRAKVFRSADRLRTRTRPAPPRRTAHLAGRILLLSLLLLVAAEAHRQGWVEQGMEKVEAARETAAEIGRESDPRRATVSLEMTAIGRLLEIEYVQKQAYPGDFQAFLRANLPVKGERDGANDLWGRPYRVEIQGGRFVLRSDGPDKKSGTADDLELSGGG